MAHPVTALNYCVTMYHRSKGAKWEKVMVI